MRWRDNGGHVPDDVWQLYWDGELTAAEAARVAAHQDVCPACREAGLLWQHLLAYASELPDEPVSAKDTAALQQHVQRRIRRQRRWEGLIAFVAAVAFVPLLLEAVAWATSVWGWLAGRLAGRGFGVELTGLVVRSGVRLLLWFGSLPPTVSLTLVLAVVTANLLLLRLVMRVFEGKRLGGVQA